MQSRWLSTLLGIGLWAACGYHIGVLLTFAVRGRVSEAPLLGKLFASPDWADRAAPTAILAVLTFLLIDLGLHALRVRREYVGVIAFRAAIGSNKTWQIASSLPDSRARDRASVIDANRSVPEALHDALPAASSIDAVSLEHGYGLTRVYVWILPVLGFIGTAWGMIHAIDGFRDALAGENIALMTDRLGQLVIPGLAHAFLTTAFALAASIVAHFCASQAHAWEQATLDGLDRACIDVLARFPRSAGSTQQPGAGFPDLTSLMTSMALVARAIERLEQRLDLSSPAMRLQESAQAIAGAAGALRQAGDTLHQSVTLPYNVKITRGA